MSDIHHPDTTARDTAEHLMRAALGSIDITAAVHHLTKTAGLHKATDRGALTAAVKDADDILDWIHSAGADFRFPAIYAAQVFYLEGNHWFGDDGWTWCKVVDGVSCGNATNLPHCADQAGAVAQATAWLAEQTRVDPAFPAPVVVTLEEAS
jgi:hypothetical protein